MKRPELPNVRSRKNPSGKTVYYIDYWDDNRQKRVREVVGSRKADAEKRAAQIYQDLKDRYLGEPSRKITDMSLRDLVEVYFRSKEGRVAAGTVRRYRYHAKIY